MKKKKLHGLKRTAITAGIGVFMAASAVPLVSVPAHAAAYQPDYSYPPTGKGGVHVSDETSPATDVTNANGDVMERNYGTDFYVAVWDTDPNDPETACKGWFRLEDQYGNPIPDVTFSLCRNDNSARIYEPWKGKGAKTAADGYLLFYVPEGEYTVILQTPDGYETFQTKIYPMAKGENEHTVILVKKNASDNNGNNNNGNNGNNNGGNNGGHHNGGSSNGNGSSSSSSTVSTGGNTTDGNKTPSQETNDGSRTPDNTGSQTPGNNGTQNPDGQKPSGPTDQGEHPSPEAKSEISLPGRDGITGTEDDITVRPGKDADGRNNATIDADGKVTLPDGGMVIHPSIPDQGKIGVEVPSGTVIFPDGTMEVPKGMIKEFVLPGKDAQLETDDDVRVKPELGRDGTDRSYLREDGAVVLPDGGTVTYADGEVVEVPSGTIVLPDGTIIYPDTEDEPSVPVDVYPYEIDFYDCWFHWLEILAMLLMTTISVHRLRRIRKVHEELDEMEQDNGNQRPEED